jgi:hypothetical protein
MQFANIQCLRAANHSEQNIEKTAHTFSIPTLFVP